MSKCIFNMKVLLFLAEVNCPALPEDAVPANSPHKYGDTVQMSCGNNKRIPEVAVGDTLDVTCQANKTWDLFNVTKYLDGCIGKCKSLQACILHF